MISPSAHFPTSLQQGENLKISSVTTLTLSPRVLDDVRSSSQSITNTVLIILSCVVSKLTSNVPYIKKRGSTGKERIGEKLWRYINIYNTIQEKRHEWKLRPLFLWMVTRSLLVSMTLCLQLTSLTVRFYVVRWPNLNSQQKCPS